MAGDKGDEEPRKKKKVERQKCYFALHVSFAHFTPSWVRLPRRKGKIMRQQSHSGSVLLILARVALPVFAERELLFAESGSYLSAFECILLLEIEKVG
jgi:hypothetical protein